MLRLRGHVRRRMMICHGCKWQVADAMLEWPVDKPSRRDVTIELGRV